MQATDRCYTSTTIPGLSLLSQVSAKPIHFFRAFRACVDAAGHWVALSDSAHVQMRSTHMFSAVHGFLGARKLFSKGIKCSAVYVWAVAKRVKKFVAAIAWFCKAAKDAGHLSARHVAWTSSVKVVQLPMDCISVVFSVVKICKIAIAGLALQRETKSQELQNQMLRLQTKAIKELLFSSVKVLDIAACALEYFAPSAHLVLSLNSLAIAAIRITALFYAINSPSSPCKIAQNSFTNKT